MIIRMIMIMMKMINMEIEIKMEMNIKVKKKKNIKLKINLIEQNRTEQNKMAWRPFSAQENAWLRSYGL